MSGDSADDLPVAHGADGRLALRVTECLQCGFVDFPASRRGCVRCGARDEDLRTARIASTGRVVAIAATDRAVIVDVELPQVSVRALGAPDPALSVGDAVHLEGDIDDPDDERPLADRVCFTRDSP